MNQAARVVVPRESTGKERLASVRALMLRHKLDYLWVRSTDRFLNEYVPLEASTRAWITGFTGSVGEALIGRERAWVFVDGRYWLQADQEVDAAAITVVRVPLGQAFERAALDVLEGEVGTRGTSSTKSTVRRIGYEPERFSVHELESLLKKTAARPLEWIASVPSLIETARGPTTETTRPVRAIDESKLDLTARSKLARLEQEFAGLGIEGMWVQTLDEIAYLTNLRGDELPFQATFRSLALVCGGRLLVACELGQVSAAVRAARADAVDFVDWAGFWARAETLTKGKRIGFDPRLTTVRARDQLKKAGAELVPVESPVGPMKAKKGPRELKAMVAAFTRADKVVAQAVDWLCSEISRGGKVSEATFAEKVEGLFRASGATGLSFKVISAAGRNGAVIHYSTPNPRRLIKQGELMLLDTGAYYDEGYATDLTRTFLVGPKSQKASREQRFYYTTVLKSAIAGMRARLPVGTRGDQLDAITRAPLWAQGLNYNHGTGHGIGINVHESPPRIAPQGSTVLEEGMVFSIEPGVYLEKFGGVRIENLCTLERIKGMGGTLAVRPLTFSPLDQRLIDRKLLNEDERGWLAQYMQGRAPK